MKYKIVTLVIIGCFVFADSPDKIVQNNIQLEVEDNNTISPVKERGPAQTLSRDTDFVYWKVDSSKNGYGAFLENNNPLAYSYDANGDGENDLFNAALQEDANYTQFAFQFEFRPGFQYGF